MNLGSGYALLNRAGRAVPRPDGRPRVWSDAEALAAGGGGPPEGFDPGFTP